MLFIKMFIIGLLFAFSSNEAIMENLTWPEKKRCGRILNVAMKTVCRFGPETWKRWNIDPAKRIERNLEDKDIVNTCCKKRCDIETLVSFCPRRKV